MRIMLIPQIIVSGALAIFAVSCNQSALSRSEKLSLLQAQARWKASNILDYTVECRILCFGPANLNVWNELTVNNGLVTKAVALEPFDLGRKGAAALDAWPTVDKMFGRIEAMKKRELPGIEVNIEAKYDPLLGYPLRVRISCKPETGDCGTLYEFRNLKRSK
jgi:hypothetical protein